MVLIENADRIGQQLEYVPQAKLYIHDAFTKPGPFMSLFRTPPRHELMDKMTIIMEKVGESKVYATKYIPSSVHKKTRRAN